MHVSVANDILGNTMNLYDGRHKSLCKLCGMNGLNTGQHMGTFGEVVHEGHNAVIPSQRYWHTSNEIYPNVLPATLYNW